MRRPNYQYDSTPFKWDRPNVGLYVGGKIRIYETGEDGKIGYCRLATDEEIRFIMMYELQEKILASSKSNQ